MSSIAVDAGSLPGPSAQPQAVAAPRSPYIASAAYDWIFFLLPPLAALGVGILISDTSASSDEFELWNQNFTLSGLLIGAFIHAHLVIVVFRSHGNPAIFRTHRLRFLLVPVLLYAAMLSSLWILIAVTVLATFWDVYHSGMQTFGFGRIYDSKAGIGFQNLGRGLDWGLTQLMYAGPILAGATMIDHFDDFKDFSEVNSAFFPSIPPFMVKNQFYFTYAVLGLGTLYIAYYLYSYWRFAQQGHKISSRKVFLYAGTALCSIYTWGFNSWGEAFFIMNLFHGFQYFGIVWASEKKNMMRIFRVQDLRFGKPLAAGILVFSGLAYGFWVQWLDKDIHSLWAITLVVSIMHFWYDGFIWSVRKKQV